MSDLYDEDKYLIRQEMYERSNQSTFELQSGREPSDNELIFRCNRCDSWHFPESMFILQPTLRDSDVYDDPYPEHDMRFTFPLQQVSDVIENDFISDFNTLSDRRPIFMECEACCERHWEIDPWETIVHEVHVSLDVNEVHR